LLRGDQFAALDLPDDFAHFGELGFGQLFDFAKQLLLPRRAGSVSRASRSSDGW